jgi:hypothetical protein
MMEKSMKLSRSDINAIVTLADWVQAAYEEESDLISEEVLDAYVTVTAWTDEFEGSKDYPHEGTTVELDDDDVPIDVIAAIQRLARWFAHVAKIGAADWKASVIVSTWLSTIPDEVRRKAEERQGSQHTVVTDMPSTEAH